MKWWYVSVSLAIVGALFFISVESVEADSGWWGVVSASGLNVRNAPSTTAAIVGALRNGDKVSVLATVQGEAVKGNATWYQIGERRYVSSTYVNRVSNPNTSYGPGERWLDVDLTDRLAKAMVGDQVAYTAEVTIGRAGFETPVGTYRIIRRVADEIMDSATIGIPRKSPNGYYYTGVLYTQYFLEGGQAFHYNYWVPDEAFGNWSSSRGCIGLRLLDAKFFWDFADYGTRVVIHY